MTSTAVSQQLTAETPTMVDHSGQPPRLAPDLFAPTPPEIGTVTSAASTLRLGKGPTPLLWRLIIGTLIAGLIVAGFYLAANYGFERPAERENTKMLGHFFGISAFLVYMFVTRFKAVCTYVGEQGVARYTLKGSRDNTPKTELLLFDVAYELFASQTRQFVNGIYTGTTYDYYWIDPAGKKLLRLKGTHRGKNAPPKQGDPFHFVAAAENALSEHFLARAQEQLQREGWIAFRVDKRRVVCVGPGFLEFHFGDAPVRVTAEEIASVTLGDGVFSFKHKDAKWYSRAGKFSFSYNAMGNAKVFLFALDRLMGYRWN